MPSSDLAITTSNKRSRATNAEHTDTLARIAAAEQAVDDLERESDAIAERAKAARARSADESASEWDRTSAAMELSILAPNFSAVAERLKAARAELADVRRPIDQQTFADAVRAAEQAQLALKIAGDTYARSEAARCSAQVAVEDAADTFEVARKRALELATATGHAAPALPTAHAYDLAHAFVISALHATGAKAKPRPAWYAPRQVSAVETLRGVRDALNALHSIELDAELSHEKQLELLMRMDGSYAARLCAIDAKKQAQIAAGRAFSEQRDREAAEQRMRDMDMSDD